MKIQRHVRSLVAAVVAVCLAVPSASGRDVPAWLARGVMAQVKAGETAKMSMLAQRGVTIVGVTGQTNVAAVAASAAAAKAEGLKVIVDVALPAGEMDVTAWAATNAIPRLVGEVADGWRLTGGKWGVSWNGLEMLRRAVDSLKPGFALVSDNPRLGNQRVVYDVDTPAPWNSMLDSVLKRKKPVTELADLWKFMRANRPEGACFLRFPLHWDVMPIAFSMCLDGVPTFSHGHALASCSKDVLPQFAALRAKEAALVEGELEWLANDRPEQVASFMRVAPDGRRIVCVFNIGKEPLSVKVSFAGQPAVKPLAAMGCTFKDSVYTFTGPGFDVRAASCDATAVSVERSARARAVAAAKLPQATSLKMVDPVYPHRGPKGSDYSVSTARDVPGYLKGAMMYQLFLRMFTPEGTLKAAERRLEFVRSLGTDIIYLCPVATSDRGTDRNFWSGRQKSSQMDNPCNPYRISDYFGIDPEYGTEQDLRDFVDAAHRLGMKVYFDLVYYHCGPNAVFLKEHPEWVLREPDGSFTLGQWAFPRLDVKNPEVREYLFENMKWYLTEFACDGFRCDVGGMLPLWYREEAYRRNKAVKGDVVMMCEGSDPREQQVAFDLCYAFPMQHAIGDFLKGNGGATNLSVRCAQREGRYPKGFHWMRCFQNHDYANCNPGETRWEKRYGIDINDGLLATIFTLDGVPMVYNGQEIADTAPHSIWSNRDHGKWGVDWSAAVTPEGTHRLALVKELARLRHAHPSFFDAPTEWLETSCPDDVYAFRRPLADGTSWITAVNISTNDHAITVPPGHAARLAGPGATLDSVSGRLVLPARSWLVAANGPFPLVRLPHRGKGLEGRFHPTYASAHAPETSRAKDVPPFLRGCVMYQLFTRMFTPEGTFAAARAKLKDLKADGIDIVYLTPHQLADDDPDPKFWSGRQKACKLNNPKNPYRQKDFFAVDPEYGTKEDLKAFVDEAHRLEMKVMFDLVYFHCGPKTVFLKDHPDFIVRNPDGTPKLGDWAFPEMDIANPAVREYLYANMVGFVRDYDVDGFRCDVADMLPVDFWEEGARRCRAVKPDVFLMCEGLKGDDQIAAFDLTYGFYTQWTMVAMLEGKSPASMLEKAWRAQVRDYPRGFHWMRCFENHDFANVNPGQKRKETLYGHELNAAMIATCFLLDGIPMLYNGQEIADASPHSIYANRDHGKWCVDWSRAGDKAAVERRALVRRLTALRHAHPDLFDAPVVWHAVPEPDKAYAFSRPLPDGTTFTLAVNISCEPVSFALPGGKVVSLRPHGFYLGE